MLRSIKDFIGYRIEAQDGDIGKVADCLFDDQDFGLRYLVADTGGWLTGRKVLVSPRDFEQPEVGWTGRHFPVKLTKEKVRDCPPLDSDAPVSRQYEQEHARYYGHSAYWEGSFIWGATLTPHALPPSEEEADAHQKRLEEISLGHLRSAKDVINYQIEATDAPIGHVADLIVDTHSWRLRHLVVDTGNWLPGRKVLVAIDWFTGFDWPKQTASVNLTSEQIRHSPPFDPHEPVNRDYERKLYDYYGKPVYWDEPAAPVF